MKRWYRSRRILLPILILTCIVCLVRVYSNYLMNEVNQELHVDTRMIKRYVEDSIQEALKEDKGSGCEIPKLDPFAKEVTQFDKSLSPIVCDGRDWVKCYHSECHLQRSIINTITDINCTYRDIIYDSDAEYHISPPTTVLGDSIYVLHKSDYVKIDCSGQEIESSHPSQWSGHAAGFRNSVQVTTPSEGRKNTYNIMIVGFDSTSKNGFIRHMPKSYEVLVYDVEAVLMNGYNIVGDGTPAALFPLLTGKNELELPDARRRVENNNITMDIMPFVFYKLKEDGYRTAFFEDSPRVGTFQYRFTGFNKQPTDHYMRAFSLEEKKFRKQNYCVGDTPQYLLMFNWTKQFFELNGKKFCFTFIVDISHDDINRITTTDEDFSRFLIDVKKSGILKNTALIVMSDHGPRFANVRATLQGKLEERLPFLAIKVPEAIQGALSSNSDALVTAHDLHTTILDIIGLQKYQNYFKVPGADFPRGLSLLKPIPVNRSCSEAGIEPHWCSCLHWIRVANDDRIYQKAGTQLVAYINSLTEPQRSLCAPRSLTSIKWLMRQKPNQKLLSFSGAKDPDGYLGKFTDNTKIVQENYQIKIVVGPGEGVYEASMLYNNKKDTFKFNSRDISRTNAYKDESKCILQINSNLNMFCYCKSLS